MINFAAMHRVRKHPAFADYFAFVLPIFWPVLFWSLLRMADQMDAHGCREVLVQVSWWGGIEITHYGDPAPSPSAYRPITPTRKPWDDPAWASALPAIFHAADTHPLFCPRPCGGSGRAQSGLTKGASTLSPHADTS